MAPRRPCCEPEVERARPAQAPDGSLEISISTIGGEPLSAEIVSAESMGYGTYEASYELLAPARMRDLHKNIVWGIFPFDWEDTYPGYQEIDIVEDSYSVGLHRHGRLSTRSTLRARTPVST